VIWVPKQIIKFRKALLIKSKNDVSAKKSDIFLMINFVNNMRLKIKFQIINNFALFFMKGPKNLLDFQFEL